MVSLEQLKKVFRGNIRISEPLAKFTTFRIGGPSDYYLEPTDKEDVIAVVRYFREQSFPFMIIGRGSNLLIHDDGYRGAAINLESGLADITVDGNIVRVGSGLRLSSFVDFCVNHDLGGIEMLAGIPGTVGGAVVINAGAFGGEISDFLLDVEIIKEGDAIRISKDEAGFGYRSSGLTGSVVLGARFKLPQMDHNDLVAKRRELLIKRNRSQPVNLPNAGSMFKNPAGTFAAKLIEDCGLKGTVIGGAKISERHANFIVNFGSAKSCDVFQLLCLAREEVYKKFGNILEPEVKLIGFGEEKLDKIRSHPIQSV